MRMSSDPSYQPAGAAGGASGREDLDARVRVALGLIALLYLAAVSAQLIKNGGWPTPDFLIPPLLLLAVAARRGWTFLIDWLPFLALVLLYEGFRGIVDDLHHRVHYASLIHADEWFFGAGRSGPSVLQSLLYHGSTVSWYDWVASAAYSAHYVLPVALGFSLWLKSRTLYWRFAASFLILFLAGFAAFYLYPAAPPWMAAEQLRIAPIDRVMVNTLSQLPATQPFALAYQRFSPNLVAAMPSLHAASPMLLALICVRVWGRKATPLLAYPILGGLAWVYLGEHYFVDVLAGWLLGIAAFVLVWGVAFPKVASIAGALARLAPRGAPFARPAPSWPLAVFALIAMTYVWFDPLIRPAFTPPPGPDWLPAAAAPAPAPAAANSLLPSDSALGPAGESAPGIEAAPCGAEAALASSVDSLLAPLAPQYSAYVVGLGKAACFSLASAAAIPPPDPDDIAEMQSDALTAAEPAILSLTDDEPGYVTVVRSGAPSAGFQQATGADPDDLYAIVIRTDGSDDPEGLLQVAKTLGDAILAP